MAFNTRYRFEFQNSSPRLVLKDADLALNGLSIKKKGKASPLFSLSTFKAGGMQFDLETRKVLISKVDVQNGKIAATIDEQGVLNWQDLIAGRF
jgi:uncharacterized protein involved in outer membrane biogenesis